MSSPVTRYSFLPTHKPQPDTFHIKQNKTKAKKKKKHKKKNSKKQKNKNIPNTTRQHNITSKNANQMSKRY